MVRPPLVLNRVKFRRMSRRLAGSSIPAMSIWRELSSVTPSSAAISALGRGVVSFHST